MDRLASSSDVIAQIAAMLVHSLREDRNNARLRSANEEIRAVREGEARVAAMREKADAIRSEGWRSGLGQIGQGALAGGGAAMQFGGDKWQKAGGILEGSSKVPAGLGDIAAKHQEGRQADCDAAAEQHRILAERASRRQEQYDGEVRDARELLSKVADFLRECNGARNSARQQAATIRA